MVSVSSVCRKARCNLNHRLCRRQRHTLPLLRASQRNRIGSLHLPQFARPPVVDLPHDPLGGRDRIGNRRVNGRRRPPVPIRELPRCKNARGDQQHALSAFVHGGSVAYSPYLRYLADQLRRRLLRAADVRSQIIPSQLDRGGIAIGAGKFTPLLVLHHFERKIFATSTRFFPFKRKFNAE
jgi:hypothetical protein